MCSRKLSKEALSYTVLCKTTVLQLKQSLFMYSCPPFPMTKPIPIYPDWVAASLLRDTKLIDAAYGIPVGGGHPQVKVTTLEVTDPSIIGVESGYPLRALRAIAKPKLVSAPMESSGVPDTNRTVPTTGDDTTAILRNRNALDGARMASKWSSDQGASEYIPTGYRLVV